MNCEAQQVDAADEVRASNGAPLLGRPVRRRIRRSGLAEIVWRASPVLGVQRVRQAAEYYRDVLGFSLDPVNGVFQPSPEEPDGVYAIVKRFGVWIHIQIRRRRAEERKRPAFERDIYVYVDDVDGLYAELERRGARIQSPPQMAPHRIREMVVEDLNGYRIAFGEVRPLPPQEAGEKSGLG